MNCLIVPTVSYTYTQWRVIVKVPPLSSAVVSIFDTLSSKKIKTYKP